MDSVRVISCNEVEALLERLNGAGPGHYVMSRHRTEFSVEEFIQEFPVGKQFETDLTRVRMRVYAVDSTEPACERFEGGLSDGLGNLFFDPKTAQKVADSIQEEYPEEKTWVAMLDVL